MTRIIAFTGAQGTGKTTMKSELVRWLQTTGYSVIDRYYGISTSISREAKKFGFIINEGTNFETQYYLAHKYIVSDLETRKIAEDNDVNFIVLDRSPLDVIAYSHTSNDLTPVQKSVVEFELLEHFKMFPSQLVYCLPLDFIDADNDRSVDKEFQSRVIKKFEYMLTHISQFITLPNISIEDRLRMLLIQLKL